MQVVAGTGSQGVPFRNPRRRPVAVRFDHERSSSDGGAVPVEAADRALGLTAAFADCLRDRRQPSEVLHSLADMLRQRVYGLACGCEDCNDAGRLGGDPVFKLPLGRDPWQGRNLPSRVTADAPSALSAVLARCVVRRRRERRPETSIVELDFDPPHGDWQLALFNGSCDTHRYLPLVGMVRFDDEREQHLVAALPRSSTAAEGLPPLLREFFPRATLRLRLDAGFQGDELLAHCEREGLEYVVCVQRNAVPKRRAAPLRAAVEARRALGGTPGTDPGGQRRPRGDPPSRPERLRAKYPRLGAGTQGGRPGAEDAGSGAGALYGQFAYRAGRWSRARRVIVKADASEFPGRAPQWHPRYAVTNAGGSPQRLYERIHCLRGDVENRVKELEHGMRMDRASCSSFAANRFRAPLAAAAYVIMQELRRQARDTPLRKRRVDGLRLGLPKPGARVAATAKRIVLRVPRTAPFRDAWAVVARGLGAVPI